jgi:putative intracellular protease/amidase
MTTFHIVEALFPGITQLDFTGPHQVFSRLPDALITVASSEGGEIRSDDGLRFAGITRLSDVTACDLLFVPGGPGVSQALDDAHFMEQIGRLSQTARYITSVCTGSLILAGAGLLRGRRAACHWAWREVLADFGAVPDSNRVVRDGNVTTGGGVTAGLDFAFVLAAEVAGTEVAQAIQLALEYDPAPPFSAGRPDLAPPSVLAKVRERVAASLPERLPAIQRAKERLAAVNGSRPIP